MMHTSFKLTILVLCLGAISSEVVRVTNEEPEKTDYLKRHSDSNEHQFGVEVTANKQFHHTKTFDDDVRLGCYGHIQDGVIHSTLYAADARGYRIIGKRDMIKVYPKFDELRYASFDDVIASEDEKFTKNVFYVFPGACLSKNITLTTPKPFELGSTTRRTTKAPTNVPRYSLDGGSAQKIPSGVKTPKVIVSGSEGNSAIGNRPTQSPRPSSTTSKRPVTLKQTVTPKIQTTTPSADLSTPDPIGVDPNFVILVADPPSTSNYHSVIGYGHSLDIATPAPNQQVELQNPHKVTEPKDSNVKPIGSSEPPQNVVTVPQNVQRQPANIPSAQLNKLNQGSSKPRLSSSVNSINNVPSTFNRGSVSSISSITPSNQLHSKQPKQQKSIGTSGSGSCCDKLEDTSFLHIPITVKGSSHVADSCDGNSGAYIRLPMNLEFKDIVGDLHGDNVDMKSVLEKLLGKYQ